MLVRYGPSALGLARSRSLLARHIAAAAIGGPITDRGPYHNASQIKLDTTIIPIGHLTSIMNAKTEAIRSAGFKNVLPPIIMETGATVKDVQSILTANPTSLFLIGGAAMSTYPKEMDEILKFAKANLHELQVFIMSKEDFASLPPGSKWPPTDEAVAEISKNICLSLLK